MRKKKFFLKLFKKKRFVSLFRHLRCPGNPELDIETMEHIIQLFKEHPSIKEIKKYKSTKEPITLFISRSF